MCFAADSASYLYGLYSLYCSLVGVTFFEILTLSIDPIAKERRILGLGEAPHSKRCTIATKKGVNKRTSKVGVQSTKTLYLRF